MPERLRIGELARRAHCQIDTVRYYESQGLLPEPERSQGNFRLYARPTSSACASSATVARST